MAVVSLKTDKWVNSDGLIVFFGASEAVATRAGEYETIDGEHITEVLVTLASLPTAAGGDEQILADNVLIPAGAFIKKVEVVVLKETTGVNANLDFGLVDQDRATEIDFNGLLAAADAFNGGTDLGGIFTFGIIDGTLTTEGGALLGTKLTNTGLLTASADTADWTAGVLRLRVFWYVPLAADMT